ncbi:sensor histidine kinase [Corynebacterium mendelii]|uniref:Sensor histidine kinase n=1 Tax=Corynebacterium mendelii TaxID=2765362 RepID=A0A939E453_9CORY|nr:sensor histidine kinase [Corynebacterium mendelii]MBN9645331.1 sensor histidine kinase [Corynebacterium mendelii]
MGSSLGNDTAPRDTHTPPPTATGDIKPPSTNNTDPTEAAKAIAEAAAKRRQSGSAAAPGASAIRQGIHVLTIGLLVVVVFSAARSGWQEGAVATGMSVAFGLIYLAGANTHETLSPLKGQLWLFALTLVWVAMIPVEQTSLYVVFPLYFLYLRVMPDIRGVIAVVAATLISIFSQWPHLTAGTILGPTVAALVTIGIDYAFRTLWKVSAEREELIEELLRTRSQLAETERSAGMAAERQRIAHEIHDTLAQGLSSIQMLLYVAEQEVGKLQLAEEKTEPTLKKIRLARQVAADNLQEARAMIAALQPAALSTTSLEGALHRAADSMVDTETTITVIGNERQLPMRTEASLLRIAQGAMGNVAKHAGASQCHVTLSYEEDEIRLDVVDDGQGFDPSAVAERPAGLGHIGLDAMRQRAAEQNGTLTVESAPGQGTAVSIAIPVGRDDMDKPGPKASKLARE